MGLEEKLPSGVLLTTVEGVAGYMRKASFWPATFGLACCAIEMMTSGGPKYDLARFGMEVFRASPRQADLMIVAGRVSQKMAPVLRQIYDQMAEPKWVLAMGVCASSGGMFNNYAIVQGVDHVVPVDMYLPGCPPRPEMLIDAILKLHDQVQATKLGANRLARDRGARGGRPQRAAHQPDEGPDALMADDKPDFTHGTARPSRHRRRRHRPDARERPRPTAPGEQIGRRQGMFGVRGTGDTSGYGGLTRPVEMPGRLRSRRTAAGWTTWPPRSPRRPAPAASRRPSRRSSCTAARSPSSSAARTSSRRPGCCATTRSCASSCCSGVSGVHYPDDRGRELHAVYHLLSMTHNRRIRLEVTAPDADPHIPSVVATYPTADWHERETFDFFGIVFDGHPALTRIQMPDDWPGHPQRKDYPLGGIPVEYKGGTIPPPDQRRSYN